MRAGNNIGKLNCPYPIFCCNMGQLNNSMHWLGIVCKIFWKFLNVARSMGKLTMRFSGSTLHVELSLLNISLLCREFLEFCNMGKLKNALWGSVLNCPYPTFHCFVRNSWNIEIGGCIVGRYAELSLTNMIWEFIKRSSLQGQIEVRIPSAIYGTFKTYQCLN